MAALNNLPRLGVYVKEAEDDFSAMLGISEDADKGSQEDKAEEPSSSLNNLLQRFDKELQHTEQIINRSAEVDKQAREHVDAFIESLGSVVSVIDSRFGAISSQVKGIVIAAG